MVGDNEAAAPGRRTPDPSVEPQEPKIADALSGAPDEPRADLGEASAASFAAADTGVSIPPTSDTAPSEVNGSPPGRDARPAHARSSGGLISALLGIAVLLLLAGGAYLFATRPDPDRLAALDKSVADLRAQVTALQARPAPADIAPIAARIDAADQQLAALKSSFGTVQARVDALPPASAATSSAPPSPEVERKMTAVQHGLEGLRTDADQMKQEAAEAGTRLTALQTKVDAMQPTDLGPLTERLASVETRLTPLIAENEAAKNTQRVTESRQNGSAAETRAAPLAVTAQAVLRAVDAGRPFGDDLKVLRGLGAESATLEPLTAVADAGAPTTGELRAELDRLRQNLASQKGPTPAGSYLDRLWAGATEVVQVRPLGSVVGDAPPAILARMDEALAKDDLAAALAEWGKLPEAARTLGKSLADRIRLRQSAQEAARAVGADAIKAMAVAQP